MKVVCIKDDKLLDDLIIGKIYNVTMISKTNFNSLLYKIETNSGALWCPDICFTTLEEYRNLKIDSILK